MSIISPMGLLEREPQLQTLREALAAAAAGEGRPRLGPHRSPASAQPINQLEVGLQVR